MLKNICIFFILLVFFIPATSLMAQGERMKLPDPNFHAPSVENSTILNTPPSGGDLMVWTGYDYETNNATRRMLQMLDLDGVAPSLDPIMVAMKRDIEGGDRHVIFGYKAFGVVDNFNAFDPSLTPVGWGEVQYCVGGPNDGQALVMAHLNQIAYHSWIDLVNFEPITPFPITTFGTTWPSFVYLGSQSGTILGVSTDMIIYASVDGGNSFNPLLIIGDGDPNVNMALFTDLPAEWPLVKSNNDNVIATLGGAAGVGLTGNPDVVYWYGSTDAGATWSGQIIGVGSGTFPEYGQVVNRNYAPYFTNFGQVALVVDPTHISHNMSNGYGEGFYMGGVDPVSVYPMLYWNSINQQWIAVTDELMEAPDDGFGNTILDNYPGNGIGNAYGTIATSQNGNVVIAMWQGPEWTGTIGSSPYNIFPGDGGANTGTAYYTNLYFNVSYDGGQTWEGAEILEGAPNVQESYPVLFADLEVNGSTATAHYVYYVDPIPGTSLFAGGNSFDPNGAWYYNTYTWTDPQIPVELTSFTAQLSNNQVVLNWQTATETNNMGFEIQRKLIQEDLTGEWIYIGYKEGAGTITEPQEYFYYDNIKNIEATSFVYRLKQVDYDGSYEFSNEITVENSSLPDEFSLSQNYPNPFNPSTSIEFQLPVKSFVSLVVYDVLGNEVATLFKEEKPAGFYEVNFNANNLVSGVYIYRLQANSFIETKKMILLR